MDHTSSVRKLSRPLPFLSEQLEYLEGLHLLRSPKLLPKDLISFASNDYLGLASRLTGEDVADSDVDRRKAEPRHFFGGIRSGAGASRLITGNDPIHEKLECELAGWLGHDSALLFSSGYAGNVGALSALLGPRDLVISDALNHASIIDGIRLSRAQCEIVAHLDLKQYEEALKRATLASKTSGGRVWVIVESYYSMDADSPDPTKLRLLCDDYGAYLYVDEAHALGIFGEQGRGVFSDRGVTPDVMFGALGKAFGLQGSFVAGAPELGLFLWNKARSFMFSTGMSPFLASVGLRRMKEICGERGEAYRLRLSELTLRLREGLSRCGAVVLGHGPIVPVLVGDERRALSLFAELRSRGFFVPAILEPTVRRGEARLRFTLSVLHTDVQVDSLLVAFSECFT